MAEIGGEINQLASLKSNFDRQSGHVQEVLSTIRGELASVYWKGPAADRFRTSWQSDYEPMLRRMEQSLLDAAAEVERRRQALIQAGS